MFNTLINFCGISALLTVAQRPPAVATFELAQPFLAHKYKQIMSYQALGGDSVKGTNLREQDGICMNLHEHG